MQQGKKKKKKNRSYLRLARTDRDREKTSTERLQKTGPLISESTEEKKKQKIHERKGKTAVE